MTYGNPYRSRKYKKRQNYRYRGTNYMARQALRKASFVASRLNTEFKSIDKYASLQPSLSTNSMTLLNGCQKGTDFENRVGRSILVKSVQIAFQAVLNGSASATRVRCILFIDKESRGSTCSEAELLEQSSGSSELTAFKNLTYRKRFVILKDEAFVLDSSNPEHVESKWIYKKLNMHTIFGSGDAGTIADIANNALYFYCVSDESINVPTIAFQARVRFLDN